MRMNRAEQQARTRAAVLTAAHQEFAERGYADTTVDRIADRAELTRGAVYSNFPGKRALYLAVLLDTLELPVRPERPVTDLPAALGAFARAWLDRLPLAGESAADGHLRSRSLTGVIDDDNGRAAAGGTERLGALLLGLALEHVAGPDRRVRVAELALTLLAGAGRMAESAPGFGDPFDVADACAHLASLDLGDSWAPAHLPHVQPAERGNQPWHPPAALPDLLTGEPVRFTEDGVLLVLGAHRLSTVEEAVRAAAPGEPVTVAVVSADPAETGRLVRLLLTDLRGCLLSVFPPDTWPALHLVLDEDGAVAAALGVDPADGAEAAARIRNGAITARATTRSAAHAVAAAD
jgi:AcrR family transcriptional regulator